MFISNLLGNTSLLLSVITTATFVIAAWMSVSLKKKSSWLKAVGFLILAVWTAGHSLEVSDALFLVSALTLALAGTLEQLSSSRRKDSGMAKEDVDRKVAEILNKPEVPLATTDDLDDIGEPPLSAENKGGFEGGVLNPKRAIKMDAGLLTKPLVKLPADRRRKARSVFNVLVGFIVLVLVGWGSYVVTKKVLQAKDDIGLFPSPTQEQAATPVASVAPTVEPTASPTVSPTPEALAKPKVTIKKTETGYLNVREGASTATAVIKQINPGESYTLLEKSEDGTWVKLQVDDTTAGWVSAKYVQEEPAPTPN